MAEGHTPCQPTTQGCSSPSLGVHLRSLKAAGAPWQPSSGRAPCRCPRPAPALAPPPPVSLEPITFNALSFALSPPQLASPPQGPRPPPLARRGGGPDARQGPSDSRRPSLPGRSPAAPSRTEPDFFGPSQGHRLHRPSPRPRPLRRPATVLRAGHSPRGDRAATRKTERATKAQGAATPLATSFIAAHPPDSGRAGRRWEAGQGLKQPIAAGRLARQCPPPNPASTNQKEGGGGRSLGFFPRGWKGGRRGGVRVGGQRKWGESVTSSGPRTGLPMRARRQTARANGSGVRGAAANWSRVRGDGDQWGLRVPPLGRGGQVWEASWSSLESRSGCLATRARLQRHGF